MTRDPVANDRKIARRNIAKAKAEARTPEQNRELMIATIIAAVRDRGSVSIDDLIRAGLKRDFITANARACLSLAREMAPDIDQSFAPA